MTTEAHLQFLSRIDLLWKAGYGTDEIARGLSDEDHKISEAEIYNLLSRSRNWRPQVDRKAVSR